MMKTNLIVLLILVGSMNLYAQINQLNFVHQNINFNAPPRSTINQMSMKLWDNYHNGGPTIFGTVLEITGLSGHQTSQLYFGGWDNSKIRYREAFYAENSWSNWVTLLDSKNNLTSTGILEISGNGNHYISQGNLGIGITTPQEKLSVNGKIRAHEIKVETSDWPDYVFEEGYKLLSLDSVQNYLRLHQHLPGIPSAQVIEKEGLALGDMNKKLLQKVEELTLYLLQNKEEVAQLKLELNKLKKTVATTINR